MTKKNESKQNRYIIRDGKVYYICGNTRIVVSEHFSDNGKPLGSLIENVILHAAKKVS